MDERLSDYLERIGCKALPEANPAGLAQLQLDHRLAIPFENFDVMLGRRISIDSDAVFDKLVYRGRGGYCFEQNRLFSDMLSAIGLPNRPLLARVMLGSIDGTLPARSHVCLLVNLGGEHWIADAGFGGSYVPPLPLKDGAQCSTGDGAMHRLRHVGVLGTLVGEWVLERRGPHESTDGRTQSHLDWQKQYVFDLAEVAPADLEQGSHWAATVPGGRFSTVHVASRALADGFITLSDKDLKIYRNGQSEKRSLSDREAYQRALNDVLRIPLSPDEVAALALFEQG
ncbi:arylamine N-acetyltransferase [Altererythrobacter indicus]|uniref:Arylamine N-acetyltransferase n=1 Tax=Altericroceibacterium indicum TaxID=374177 RepID=A0A845AIA2_9SPHN|nr:arylamine N-acetyltransferase [Altericroceibacterium indicum]MXP26838.1 arylamine N-acetyltransferase [Altericroceibacterium indicum]